MKNVVLFGGGSGLSCILKGIKTIPDINISAIVTVADSGGSAGVIRREYDIAAIGDIRKVMVALSKKEHLLNDLMKYRFPKKQNLEAYFEDHSLGNLIIISLIDMKNSFYEGIHFLSEIFNIYGEIIPITDYAKCQLKAILADGTEVIGEQKISHCDAKISLLTYCDVEKIIVNPKALHAIEAADVIIFACGSLYTSLIANLTLPEISKCLISNKDTKMIYMSNIVTQPNETLDMDALDHINEIEKYLNFGMIDYIVINDAIPNQILLDKYAATNSVLILPNDRIENSHCEVIAQDLIDDNNDMYIRHDSKKIKKVIKKILQEI